MDSVTKWFKKSMVVAAAAAMGLVSFAAMALSPWFSVQGQLVLLAVAAVAVEP